ncbi:MULTISPECIES: glycerophosphodiester phosphodiesterase [Cytobacillus]|uniref:Glycerophosphodiester phosphodiesterase n=1 Tax=Cytobacillus kochii TaxID=859143 RepID=A0A248TFW4_9BACI|nr:glycerophosphodiester phosphodiesterase [Cytobacillus kochii]MDQ0185344.1 glycerophosphoryl diester phosphodiesterase [Cytobacillus kochii]
MKKVLLFCLLATVIFVTLPFGEAEASRKEKEIANVAHRGASGYAPENTIAAFDLAVAMGADYIEIDVQRSKDGKLVILHDTTVDRTTDGTGKVGDLDFKELRQLDAGSWKGEEFAGEKIPSFDEVLDRYKGKIGILIELKAPELYPGIEKQMTKALKKRKMDKPKREEVIVQSFNFESMKLANKLLPRMPIGVLTSSPNDVSDEALKAFRKYADYFNPSIGLVNEELVKKVRKNKMKIQSWTVRTPEAAQFLKEMKVDGIITDYPDYVY